MRSAGMLRSVFNFSIIIFKIVDFPQRRTPVRIFTKGVSVYAIIWFKYKGLSIIGIASYLG